MLRRCLVKDLTGEVVEHRFAAFGFDVLWRSSAAVDALEHQRQSGGPAAALSVEHVDQRCIHVDAWRTQCRASLPVSAAARPSRRASRSCSR